MPIVTMDPSDAIELVQLLGVVTAIALSGVSLVKSLVSWGRIMEADEPDRRVRLAAFGHVMRELIRLLALLVLLVSAAISYVVLPSPPSHMIYREWLLIEKVAVSAAIFTIMVGTAWDLYMRSIGRRVSANP